MTALLATPRTTPKVAMYWELAAPLAENRIIESKLRFYHHLVCLDNDSIAFKVHQCQRRLSVISLTSECRKYLAQLNISESEIKCYSKSQWKKTIGQKLREKNRQDVLEKMKSYTKFNYFEKKNEEFELKGYFKEMKLEDCRMMFSLKAEMTKSVKTHFFSDPNFARELRTCQNCQKIYSISHIKICPFYAHLREKLDVKCDVQLTQNFKEVLKLRGE